MKKTISTVFCCLFPLLLFAQASGPQIYNLSFDDWSKSKGAWNLYPLKPSSDKKVWDSANHGLSLLGKNGAEPETEIVAVPGPGKKAAKLHSEKVLWAFAAGNIYTGEFKRIINFSGAEITLGTPFNGRPKSLSGYYYYIPKRVNYAREPYLWMKGKMDIGEIEVMLTDWDEPFHVITNDDQFVDMNDPHIIGHGKMKIKEATDGYVHFELNIDYRDDRIPKMVYITAASSYYGGYFTGGNGSTLYLDEFQFNY